MGHCPTCNARYRGQDTCRRCNADLREIVAIEKDAETSRLCALEALSKGRLRTARAHATRACRLHRSRENLRVKALTALYQQDHLQTLRLLQELEEI